MNGFYDRCDGPKCINFSGANYLSNNVEFSMYFWERLDCLRLQQTQQDRGRGIERFNQTKNTKKLNILTF